MTSVGHALGGTTTAFLAPPQARIDELGVWFHAHYASLLRFAYFVAGDTDAAEDLVQDAFVKLYRAGARVDAEGIGAYARRTIANLARSRFRRHKVASRAPVFRAGASEGSDIGVRDEVWRAVLGLSPKQRAVIALKFYEDLAERDIAFTLGMSAGSVKKHSDRAMKKLRETLGRES